MCLLCIVNNFLFKFVFATIVKKLNLHQMPDNYAHPFK